MRVDLEDVRQVQMELQRINDLNVSDIELYEGDERIVIPEFVLKKWKYIGLTTFDFFAHDFFREEDYFDEV